VILHFYHALDTADGHRIYDEHLALMSETGFSPDMFEVNWVKPGDGFEELTLNRLRAAAKPGDRILYSHTKGAFTRHPINENWRQAMDSRLIGPWRSRVCELDDYDLVGMHWLTPEEFGQRGVKSPFFGGNFWWTRGEYILTLPEVPPGDRYAAENWVGSGNPVVKDLSPGWPTY
jgi:hypothetical protein